MAVVDQKERYRRRAALCYELAAKMTASKAASMVRLGDTYSALALNQDRVLPHSSVSAEKYRDPHCKKCGRKMQLTHSLPRTRNAGVPGEIHAARH